MKYAEFKSGLDSGEVFSVYLFEGEDAFFRERGLSLLKNKFVSEPDLNFTSLSSDCGVEQLISSLNGYPFMSEKRLTVVREFYPKQEFFKNGLKAYLENPSEFGIFVILNEKPCDALKKFNCVCFVDCSKADVSLLVRWVKSQCSSSEVSIDGETAKTICEYCLSDMTRIENEKVLTWDQLYEALDSNFADERVRLMLNSSPKYCHGGTVSDGTAAEAPAEEKAPEENTAQSSELMAETLRRLYSEKPEEKAEETVEAAAETAEKAVEAATETAEEAAGEAAETVAEAVQDVKAAAEETAGTRRRRGRKSE